eukprot:SAG11_NODE_1287_length_5299_cov_7.428654_4_plen_82_part_00
MLFPFCMMLVTSNAAPFQPTAAAGWDMVRNEIDSFARVGNCHVIVGNASGQVFSHQKGSAGLDTDMQLYSASKVRVPAAPH